MNKKYNLYQARNGAIRLATDKYYTPLTLKQISDLEIDINKLKDFNKSDFIDYYQIPPFMANFN